mmetsp:Transcript_38977/g.44412  ORF Transcript_38977/g.44412 Transcript_38977/m.44412 type:complete len:80 (+) Transcript_38977:1227-1466(+)
MSSFCRCSVFTGQPTFRDQTTRNFELTRVHSQEAYSQMKERERKIFTPSTPNGHSVLDTQEKGRVSAVSASRFRRLRGL